LNSEPIRHYLDLVCPRDDIDRRFATADQE